MRDACPVGPREFQCSDRRGGGCWWFPAAHSDLRVLKPMSARLQVMTVALAQWEEPGVCTKERGRAS